MMASSNKKSVFTLSEIVQEEEFVAGRGAPVIEVTHPCIPDSEGYLLHPWSAGIVDPIYTARSINGCAEVTLRAQSLSAPVPASRTVHLLKPDTQPIESPPLVPGPHRRLPSLSLSTCSDISSVLDAEKGIIIYERIKNLVKAFTDRANRVKERIAQPPTPSSLQSTPQRDKLHCRMSLTSLESAIRRDADEMQQEETYDANSNVRLVRRVRIVLRRLKPTSSFDPQSKTYIAWLLLACICFAYNACCIVLRATFPYQTRSNQAMWFACDYFADLVYIIDIILMRSRVRFLKNGFWICDWKEIRKHYHCSRQFVVDVVSLLPLDIFYFVVGPNPLLRLPRLLKVRSFSEFFDRCDRVASTPYLIRIVRTLLYMLYLIHLNTCAYYAFSAYEGLGINEWVYDGVGNAYVRCLLFATKTATSIGKNPTPQNEGEYVFMTVSWLLGVFVCALIIGQIRDILSTASQSKREYLKMVDRTLIYMQLLKLPSSLCGRVRLWFTHNWDENKSSDEAQCLTSLPRKMQMDIAMYVHFDTLSKVKLLQDMERTLLRELVLKLKPVLYLPGDYICRKGEVGMEMYIVNYGQIEVIAGANRDVVVATLYEGSVFGEVSLLSLEGGNRRTADVRSKGFSRLFVLTKDDLHDTIKDYPEAQEKLHRTATRLMKKTQVPHPQTETEIEPDIVIEKRADTPKMLRTVIQVMSSDSMAAKMLQGRCRSFRSLQEQLKRETSDDVRPDATYYYSNSAPVINVYNQDGDEILVVETSEGQDEYFKEQTSNEENEQSAPVEDDEDDSVFEH